MRKYAFAVVVLSILLMAGISFAQMPRNNTVSVDGKTSFTNVAAVGVEVDGVPGYLELTSSAGRVFYLYIDDGDFVKIASAIQVGSGASPQVTDWSNQGIRVGSQ
jgi:hypothetical protein